MKKYEVEIHFVNGDKAQARVDARNRKDALRRVKETAQYKDFASQCGDILTASVEQEEREETIDTSRFVVSSVNGKEGWYVVADLENRIKVEFKKGHYNDMQKVTCFGEGTDALKEATALREIGEYMSEHFNELI